MAEENKCPQCGKVCKTPQALKAHIQWKHSGAPGTSIKSAREVPIVEEDFATLLRKYKVKGDLAANIAEHISHTGGPSVFEKPELLLKGLVAWSNDIAPGKRKLIMERWFAEKQIDISSEVQQKVGMTTDQLEKEETVTKEGAGVRYVLDEKAHIVRMAKEGERGGTLEEAKELLKMEEQHEKEGAESPFMQDGEGRWVLNPKATVTGMELMAVQFMQQAQAKGEPADPIEAMSRAAETWKTLREGLGGGAGTQPAWMTDPVSFIDAIKTITGKEGLGGGGGTLPTWMTDPVAFVEAIKTITGKEGLGGGGATQPTWMTDPAEFTKMIQSITGKEGLGGGGATQPTWMTDPAEFTKMIQSITGKEGLGGGAGTQAAWMTDPVVFVETIKKITGDAGGDSALKEAMVEMRQSLDAMKEQRYQDQFAGMQQQIKDVSNVLKQTLDTISDLQKGRVGRSEMDIIHEIVTGGKEELSGLRHDVREAFTSSSLPPRKTTEEREGRKQQTRKALKTDQEIEDLGKRLFFPQG